MRLRLQWPSMAVTTRRGRRNIIARCSRKSSRRLEMCAEAGVRLVAGRPDVERVVVERVGRAVVGHAQLEALREGLGFMLSLDSLHVLAWEELECLVCGNEDFDVEALKVHTALP